MGTPVLPDGIVAIVKADCPTCTLVRPVLTQLKAHVVSEDTDEGLDIAYELGVETVPTLLRVERGHIVERTEGWMRHRWEGLTGVESLGRGLPDRAGLRDAGLRGRLHVVALREVDQNGVHVAIAREACPCISECRFVAIP